jgi:manganese/zinc/iron transport system permease protein
VIYSSACAVGLATCYIIDRLSKVQYLSKDSSNGMVFSLFFALGIAIISIYSKNAHVGPELLMGDPDALEPGDIPGIFFAALTTVVAVPFLLRGCTVAIFDPSFAAVSGFNPNMFMQFVLLLTSMASIIAFRAVGFVMTMAFFVLPPLLSRMRATSIAGMLGLSATYSLIVAFLAVGLSRHLYTVYALSVSTGAFAAVLLAVVFFVACVFRRCLKKVRNLQKDFHGEGRLSDRMKSSV